MITKADDYPVHQTPDPIAHAQSDRNFYDRFFFNGYAPGASEDGFFAAAMGAWGVRVHEVGPTLDAVKVVRAWSARTGHRTSLAGGPSGG